MGVSYNISILLRLNGPCWTALLDRVGTISYIDTTTLFML